MKNKYKYLIFLSLIVSNNAMSQWLWSEGIGGASSEYLSRSCVDNSGNVYLAGDFGSNPCIFPATSLSCNGVSDFFLSKYDPNGAEQWVRQFGGFNSPGQSEGVGDIAFDSNNNCVYITGNFAGICNFNSIIFQSYDSADIFIAKFSLSGNCIWAKRIWGNGNGYSNAITVDNAGNIYIGGNNNDSAHFDNYTISSGSFLAKYDTSGNCQWVKSRFYDNSTMISTAKFGSLKVYNNDIYTAGDCFNDTIVIDAITVTDANTNFIARFDNNGNAIWLKTFAAPSGTPNFPALIKDGTGNFYVATSFHSLAVFGSDTLHSNSTSDFVLAKYDENGIYTWSLQGMSSQNASTGRAQIAMTNDGGILMIGTFLGTIQVGSYTATSSGLSDLFFARFDNNGNAVGLRQVADVNSSSLCVDNNDQIYISGSFWSSATFGVTPTLTTQGGNDIYITKSDIFTGIGGVGRLRNNLLTIYTNPNLGKCDVRIPDDFLFEKNLVLSIYDGTGKLIQKRMLNLEGDKLKINLEQEAKGIYNVTLSNGTKSYGGKIIFE
jgi:hypothetical protein